MKTYSIEGIRNLLRINDENGKLVAYVSGDSPQQTRERADLIVKALAGQDTVLTEWKDRKEERVCDVCGTHVEAEAEPLETPVESLGISVDDCDKAPDKKHFPNMNSISGHILNQGTKEELYVIDAVCKYCGKSGSRCVNPLSFNWD